MTTATRVHVGTLEPIVATMVDRLVSEFRPKRIILFGSRARGDAGAGSDVDLLVVVPDLTDTNEAALQMRSCLSGLSVAKDILVTTPAEIAYRGHVTGSVLHAALREGRVVHDGDGVIETEALQWLEIAEEDLEVVRWALSSEPPRLRSACDHAQQAAEKALKAALVFEAVEIPYTHDLTELRGLLPEGWPLQTPSADLKLLTGWAAGARYPGSATAPSTEDAAAAGAAAESVYDDITAGFERRGVLAD